LVFCHPDFPEIRPFDEHAEGLSRNRGVGGDPKVAVQAGDANDAPLRGESVN
jgi:hypothetical protein